MNVLLNTLLIVSCASVSLGQLFIGPENVHSVDPQTPALSKQQMTTIEKQLARLLDLPTKKFDLQKREKRMIRSENRFLLELYENGHPKETQSHPSEIVTTNHHIKTWKKNFYANWTRHKRTVRGCNYVATFGCRGQTQKRTELVFKFETKSMPKKSDLVAAELRLFRKPKPVIGERTFQISIRSCTKNGILIKSRKSWSESDRGWVVLDVTNLVSENHNRLEICISAKLRDLDASMETVGISGMDSHVSERPFLVTYFDADLKFKEDTNVVPRENCRILRAVEDPGGRLSKPDVPAVCTLRILNVNFRALDKFTSVIIPETYQANYCVGKCKFPLQGRTTNHAIVQALYSSVKATFEPLCAPAKLSALDVIHLDGEENMVHKTYKEMVVEKCSCQ